MTAFRTFWMGAAALACVGALSVASPTVVMAAGTAVHAATTTAAHMAATAAKTTAATTTAATKEEESVKAAAVGSAASAATKASRTLDPPVAQPAATPPGPPPAFTGLEYVTQVPIGLEDARRTALAAHPGKVTNSALGPDKSGKIMRYVFVINGANVYVDANTNKVIASDP